MYKYTCMDSLLHSTACKHIYLVHMQQIPSKAADNEHNMETNTVESTQILAKKYSTAFQQYATLDHDCAGNASASEALISTCKELELLIPKVKDTNAILHATKSISLLKGTLADDKIMLLKPTSTYQ